jgi:hypothetical protein
LRDVTVPAATEAGLSGHAAQIDEFLRCLRDGGVPETICTDNVKSLVMVHAAIAGSEKGRRVRIEELGV